LGRRRGAARRQTSREILAQALLYMEGPATTDTEGAGASVVKSKLPATIDWQRHAAFETYL